MEKIAIVGSGISGLASAYLWSQEHDVTLFEKNKKFGGHTDTTTLTDGQTIDTGFIVCNDHTYPVLHDMFLSLNVLVRKAEMSFSFYDHEKNQFYAGNNLNGLFANRRNIFSFRFYKFLMGVLEFGKKGLKALGDSSVKNQNVSSFFIDNRIRDDVIDDYVLPMVASIWSAPKETLLKHPAQQMLSFLKHHGLLDLSKRPQWQTVEGRSQAYIDAIFSRAKFTAFRECPVHSIQREGRGVRLVYNNEEAFFDRVIVAVHADDVLSILKNPYLSEADFFGAWAYEKNHVTVHKDVSLMPPKRRSWASWNYLRHAQSGHEKLIMTYYATLLQGMDPEVDYFISLNAKKLIDPHKILFERSYKHPIFTLDAVSQREMFIQKHPKDDVIQYVGSYFGFGFHEDGVRSAKVLGEQYGLAFPR